MKQTAILTTTSLLSILLLTLHITDDIVRGISKAEPSNIALLVLAVLLYGTLVLAERRSGHVIMLLGCGHRTGVKKLLVQIDADILSLHGLSSSHGPEQPRQNTALSPPRLGDGPFI